MFQECAKDGAHLWVPNSDEEEATIRSKVSNLGWGYVIGFHSNEKNEMNLIDI